MRDQATLPSPSPSLGHDSLDAAVAGGRTFLARRQRGDGTLIDYALEPGAGVSWPTALAGLALVGEPHYRLALERACRALEALRRPEGWGYNQRTACDADSTAWALRLLAACPRGQNAPDPGVLARYLDHSGECRTFVPHSRFGSWGDAHPDVTPVVGLAWVECDSGSRIAGPVRRAVLRHWSAERGWPCFWWTTTTYTSARSLELLAATGGIPSVIATLESARLGSGGGCTSVFELAQRLAGAAALGCERAPWGEAAARDLVSLQLADGSWPPSWTLRVPSQHRAGDNGIGHADTARVVGTAHAVLSLVAWRRVGLA